MLEGRASFYRSVLRETIQDRHATILVLAAGPTDKAVFESLGYSQVTFSNVDELTGGTADFAPHAFQQHDAESIECVDGAFDYAVIHAALHHCHSPHRALLEMYRVGSRGVLAFEARDSALMRLLERLKMTESYECSAVRAHGGRSGGVRNGPVPNFIYRWTEREVEKTIDCYEPHARHQFTFHYGNDTPAALLAPGHSVRKSLIAILYRAFRLVAKMMPRQQNLFAFAINKPTLADSRPWIRWVNGQPLFDMDWAPFVRAKK